MTNTVQTSPTDPALVHAYIDNELDPASALAVARQIAADPALAAEAARTEALRNAIRERLPREQLPPHLRTRIDAAIGLRRNSSHPTWHALAASVAFAVVLASGSTWLTIHPTLDDRTAEAVVDGHIRALMAPQPADVSSSERHTVKPWFNGRIPVSPRVVDLAAEDFPLIGGRIDVVDAVPTPTLVYSRRKHVISLFAIPDAGVNSAPIAREAINGYNVAVWRQDQVTYWAVSDLNATELETFAEKFQAAP